MRVITNYAQKYLKPFWIWLAIFMLLSTSNATENPSTQNHFLNPISLQFTDIVRIPDQREHPFQHREQSFQIEREHLFQN